VKQLMGVFSECGEGGEATKETGDGEREEPVRVLTMREGTEEDANEQAADQIAGDDAGGEAVECRFLGDQFDPARKKPTAQGAESSSEEDEKSGWHGSRIKFQVKISKFQVGKRKALQRSAFQNQCLTG